MVSTSLAKRRFNPRNLGFKKVGKNAAMLHVKDVGETKSCFQKLVQCDLFQRLPIFDYEL